MGPFSREDILEMKASGQVQGYHECSQDGRSWQPVENAAEFATQRVSRRKPEPSGTNSAPAIAFEGSGNGGGGGFTRFRLLVASVVGIIVLGIGAAVFLVVQKPRDTRLGPTDPSREAKDLLVSSFSDLPMTEQTKVRTETVGFVIAGIHIRYKQDGSWIERPFSTGSGFVVSPGGRMITNKHVVEEIQNFKGSDSHTQLEARLKATVTPKLWVFFGRDTRCECEVVHQSADFDLAILDTGKANSRYLAMCFTGDSEIPHLKGLSAIGFPGNDRSAKKMLEGNIAAAGRGQSIQHTFDDTDFRFSLDGGDVRKTPISLRIDNSPAAYYLVHSASTAHGNSGGPLLCRDGTVVGINTIIRPVEVKDTQGNKVVFAQGGQNYALTLPQLKKEIDRYVPEAVWRTHPE